MVKKSNKIQSYEKYNLNKMILRKKNYLKIYTLITKMRKNIRSSMKKNRVSSLVDQNYISSKSLVFFTVWAKAV